MTVTELLWPVWKSDAESLAALQSNEKFIGETFESSNGLHFTYTGKILEENGEPVANPSAKGVFVLEWDKLESFQAFFPQSEKFQNFIKRLAPYIAVKAIPELFSPVTGSPVPSLTSPVTQIVKAQVTGPEAEGAWANLVKRINEGASEAPQVYRATGIEKDDTYSVAFIGWKSFKEYERVSKSASIVAQIKALGSGHDVLNIVAEFRPVSG